ncbi:hypothetical protein K388_07371 [Streptomyces sp. KhCrAH-43]|uniref:hypothetical protein n=1 Tax=unclassified Streptomyces TaxID=2593676 RepID=UPI00037C5B1C|nr:MULTISPECIES: hypothetical protein [unclassified Streptomyces]MYS39146.1 hypothetical protein [Streptomyces sp. SID4920]MYX64146.1 hypothetical protein [Streptomyces sp. SID8373]RAJ44931.1 hypothetical protein K388_07371 [Streptomyces sp. KhCrAH-43]
MNVTPIPPPRSGPRLAVPGRRERLTQWLGCRLGELDSAARLGWRPAALWIKATVVILGVLTTGAAVSWIVTLLTGWAHALPWPTPTDRDHTGLLATIDDPLHRYLATHTQGLPVTATTVYSAWQVTGVLAFALGVLRSSGGRLLWICWGAATTAAVWQGTPEPGRQVAAVITVLAWAALSTAALRGLSLRPGAFVHTDVHPPQTGVPEIRNEIHLPKAQPPAYGPFDPHHPPSMN